MRETTYEKRTLGTPWESRSLKEGFKKDRSKLSLWKAPENDRRAPGSGTWKDRSSKGPELSHRTKVRKIGNDTQTNMLTGYPMSAICVQRFDDSLNSAIHITYRNWLRSSSMHEPRDPPLKVVNWFYQTNPWHTAPNRVNYWEAERMNH